MSGIKIDCYCYNGVKCVALTTMCCEDGGHCAFYKSVRETDAQMMRVNKRLKEVGCAHIYKKRGRKWKMEHAEGKKGFDCY